MGYCITASLSLELITVENVPKALAAVNRLHHANPHRCYAWVENPPLTGFESLGAALEAWRYHSRVEPDGGVQLTYHSGEKWGDDEVLFEALAPFLEGEVTFVGEDDHAWKYVFKDGKMDELSGNRVFV